MRCDALHLSQQHCLDVDPSVVVVLINKKQCQSLLYYVCVLFWVASYELPCEGHVSMMMVVVGGGKICHTWRRS